MAQTYGVAMAIRVTISSDELEQATKRLTKTLQNPRPLLRRLGETAVESVRGYFDAEKSPAGQPWKALSPRYLTWKIKRGFSPRILRKRGKLIKGIRYALGDSSLIVGSDHPAALVHQFGATINRSGGQRTVGFKVSKSGKSRFARKGRANFEQSVSAGPYTIKIPARPYLSLGDDPTFVKAAELLIAQNIDHAWSGESRE
jgi:phage virion morphogenesis protein